MNKIILTLIFILLCSSCHYVPKDVRLVLKAAGENRSELEKVIDHYKAINDKEKLKAAYFLIGNMDNKFTIECEEIKKYDPIFAVFDSLKKNNIRPTYNSSFLKAKWDSLVNVIGPPSFRNAKIIPDYSIIKADYLIDNIDIAFKLREESQWGKKISFEKFCEFVLPYRVNHEPLERWRTYFYNQYKTKLDSINAGSGHQLAVSINKFIPKVLWYEILMAYPYDIPNSKMIKILKGSCPNIVAFYATAMRSIGLPVGIVSTPLFGNFSRGHKWNVLFSENGKPFHFERDRDTLALCFIYTPPDDTLTLGLVYKPAKVFLETFGRQKINITDPAKEVPGSLLDNHKIDITGEFFEAFNMEVPIKYSPESKKRYAVICTFNNRNWIPLDFGRIKRGKAHFNNMGPDIVYLVMYYNKGMLFPASDPFVLRKEGNIEMIIPSKVKPQDMFLLRKFTNNKPAYYYDMVNGYFQGANKADFSDSVKLYTITSIPKKIETAEIYNSSKFRYVRYKSHPPARGNVAELYFYGGMKNSDTLLLHGKVIGFPEVTTEIGTLYQNVFDGNLETYFNSNKPGLCWVGLDLGTSKRITRIRYCPRSDTNFILMGDTYELCYWENGEWFSLGTQIAKDQYLLYKNVPSGALYILHNLTRGKEERIFTYENGLQVWW